jgi:hypothetical protein
MKKTTKRMMIGALALAALALVPGATGCDDDSSSNPDPEQARLRVIHLSADAPEVDVLANGADRVVSGLAFAEGTAYLTVDEGTYDFAVVPAGGAAGDSVLDINDLMLAADGYYTAVAYGALADLRALALVDDMTTPASGEIRVRAIHAAPAVGEVDIWNVPATGSPSALYEDVGYGVAGDALDLPAGAYTLGLDVDNDAVPDLLFDLPALAAGTIANVFAVSDADGAFLLAQLGDGSVARIDPREPTPSVGWVRAIHLSPDAPAVDVLVDGTVRAFEGLAFGEGSTFAELEAGSYDLDIVPAGGAVGDSVLNVADAAIPADGYVTAVAFDELSMIQGLLLVDDFDGLAATDIRVRAIHTASAVGEVDIWNLPATGDPGLLYENVGFGAAGDYIDLPAAAYRLGFDVDNDMVPDVTFQLPALEAGTTANIFAVSDADGVFLLAQLPNGDVARIDAETPTPTTGRIRALHLSFDAPEVDVLVNGTIRAFTGVAFGEGSGYADLDVGTYDLDVVPAGGAVGDSVLNASAAIAAGGSYTAVAYGPLATIDALLLEDDDDGLAAGQIRIRAIHAASAVGEVDIWNIPASGAPSILYENVPFGAAGSYLDLPAAAYTLGFDVNNDASPDVIFDVPALPAGTVANVFAVSDASAVYLLAQLEDGTLARVDPTP